MKMVKKLVVLAVFFVALCFAGSGCVRGGAYHGGGHIRVIAATYGRDCGVPYGNVTNHLAEICDGRARCEYIIDFRVIGDPAPNCAKDYFAQWACGRDPERGTISVRPEATGTRILLRCPVR
jgi:hypothetical protein